MNSENVIKHLRALWRTDRIIADIRMRHMLIGLGLRAFAALIAAFGLLMLELSAYFALVQIWSAILAAAILGAVNFAIAAILFLIAGRPPGGRELELASRNPWLGGGGVAARGAGVAVAGIRGDPQSAERHPAFADRSADHDHHQEPEEAGSQTGRRGADSRRGTEIIASDDSRRKPVNEEP